MIAVIALPVGRKACGAVDQADFPAALGIEVSDGVVAAGVVIGDDAADAAFLLPDDLGHRNASGVNIPQEVAVTPCTGYDNAIHETIAQAV